MFFEITDLSDIDQRVLLAAKILASLVYPDDTLKLNGCVCSLFVSFTSLKTPEQKKIFSSLGGVDSLIRADSLNGIWNEHEKNYSRWTVASDCIQYLATMNYFHKNELRGGASISKALALIVHESESKINKLSHGYPNNSKYIKDAWSKFKHVSHLCAALQILESHIAITSFHEPNLSSYISESIRPEQHNLELCGPLPYIVNSLEMFLNLAVGFQNFITEFTPLRSSGSIVGKDSFFIIPHQVDAYDLFDGQGLDPMEPDRLEFLIKRKAPKIPE
ncbi:MAG: hypothetical protein COA86_12270 [Kangiella sp.]|nr:MAG: hypothetical protein COA86_12270 [Kangiella sp.]